MRKNDRQKFKRLAKSKRHVRMRLTNVKDDPEKQMLLFAEADKHAVLGERQLAVGTWQHPCTGLRQVWFSTAGGHISWISAHRSPERADQDVEEFKASALFVRLAQGGEAEPEAMNAVEILNITKHISEKAFDIPKEQQP
jgi:hypothetical protein